MPPALLPQITLTCHALPCHPFLIHRLLKNIAAAEHPGSRNGDDSHDAAPPTAERLSHNWPEQSLNERRHLLAESCARDLYCTQKSQTRRAGFAWPVPVQWGVEQSPVPTALYTPFISSYSDSFHHDRARGNNRLGSAPCFPCRWLHTAWGLMFLAVKWIQLFFSRTEGTGGAWATVCSLGPAHWGNWCQPVLRADAVLQSWCKWLYYWDFFFPSEKWLSNNVKVFIPDDTMMVM